MECPIHVAAHVLAVARGYATSGVAVGNEPRGGVGARDCVRRSLVQRSTSPHPRGSLSGHGLRNEPSAVWCAGTGAVTTPAPVALVR